MPELYLLHLGARHGAADVDYEDDVLRDGGQPGGCEEVDEVSVVQLHVPRGVRPRHVVLQHKTTQCCPVLGGGREGNVGAVRAFLHPDGWRQPPSGQRQNAELSNAGAFGDAQLHTELGYDPLGVEVHGVAVRAQATPQQLLVAQLKGGVPAGCH